MRNFVTLIIFVLAVSGVFAQKKTADYSLHVQNFRELTVVDGVGVDYVCNADSAGWAVFCCGPDVASHIMFENKAEHLTVRTDADESPVRGVPRVRVYSALLSKVTNSGDSLLRVHSTAPVDEFRMYVIGNGEIKVTGVDAREVDVRISAGNGRVYVDGRAHRCSARNVGTGLIDASRLDCDEFSCFVLGPGNIHCRPASLLKVYGAGSGVVYYHTKPAQVKKRGLGLKARPYSQAPEYDRISSLVANAALNY